MFMGDIIFYLILQLFYMSTRNVVAGNVYIEFPMSQFQCVGYLPRHSSIVYINVTSKCINS